MITSRRDRDKRAPGRREFRNSCRVTIECKQLQSFYSPPLPPPSPRAASASKQALHHHHHQRAHAVNENVYVQSFYFDRASQIAMSPRMSSCASSICQRFWQTPDDADKKLFLLLPMQPDNRSDDDVSVSAREASCANYCDSSIPICAGVHHWPAAVVHMRM
jgi:hypothetical protein